VSGNAFSIAKCTPTRLFALTGVVPIDKGSDERQRPSCHHGVIRISRLMVGQGECCILRIHISLQRSLYARQSSRYRYLREFLRLCMRQAAGVLLCNCHGIADKYLSEELKGEVYKALPTLLYGCEAWSLREDLLKRLRSFHNRCARSMCRVNLHHTFRHHITSASLFRRLGILDTDSCFHDRILRWAGHVARMPMSRAPRQLLTGWVSHSRPIGCPQMTWGRALENALKSKDISKEFDEWIAIASLPRTGRSGDS